MHTTLRPSRKQNKDESSLRASSLRGRGGGGGGVGGGGARSGAGGKEGASSFRFFPVSHPHPPPSLQRACSLFRTGAEYCLVCFITIFISIDP